MPGGGCPAGLRKNITYLKLLLLASSSSGHEYNAGSQNQCAAADVEQLGAHAAGLGERAYRGVGKVGSESAGFVIIFIANKIRAFC